MKAFFRILAISVIVALFAASFPTTASAQNRQATREQMAKAGVNASKGKLATAGTAKPKSKTAAKPQTETAKPKAKETAKPAAKTTQTKAKATATAKTKEMAKPDATTTHNQTPDKAAPKANDNPTTKYIITDKGVGPIVLGINGKNLPASVPGLYASKNHVVPTEEEKEESWYYFQGWQFMDEKGNDVISAEEGDDGIIYLIVVNSDKIQMENGMHVGMTQKQVEAFKGVKKIVPGEWEDYPRLRYEVGDISLLMDWEDGKTVQGIEISTPYE